MINFSMKHKNKNEHTKIPVFNVLFAWVSATKVEQFKHKNIAQGNKENKPQSTLGS